MYNSQIQDKLYYKLSSRDFYKYKELGQMRIDACGIGTNKMKRRLAKLAKSNPLADAYYLAFKAEEASILAKAFYLQNTNRITDIYYCTKESLIWELAELCKENGYKYGEERIAEDYEDCIHHIIYFELPGCEQISWHCPNVPDDTPVYDGVWDEAEKTTLKKLEGAIGNMLASKLQSV